MKHIKSFRLYENNSDELPDLLNMVVSDAKIYELPYAYYGDPSKNPDFNIYVIIGNRSESDDHKLLQEIYHNHKILNEVYNLELFHIGLTKNEVIITLKDYKNDFYGDNKRSYTYKEENYLSKIKESFLRSNLPLDVFMKIKPYLGSFSSSDSKFLSKGIDYSNGNSGNLSLFDWVYKV